MARRARIVGVVSQKGGVGKTTTAVNLAASLAVLDRSVLLVDLDPQGAVATCFGIKRGRIAGGTYDVFVGDGPMSRFILEAGRIVVGVVPVNIWTDQEEEAYTRAVRADILVRELDLLRSRFDYVLLDSPPTIGSVAVAAMAAADALLIPVQCEELAVLAVGRTLRLMRKVRETLNPGLVLDGLVVTMADSRTTLTTEIVNNLRRTFGNSLLRTLVPRTVDLARSVSQGEPLLYYDARSVGAQAYLNLAGELVQRMSPGGLA